MRKSVTVAIVCSLLLAGCAGKKAVEDQEAKNTAPASEKQAVAEPEAAPQPESAKAEPSEPEATQAAQRIFFEFDSYQLTPESKQALSDNALWLKTQPQVRLVIEGHADERGSDTYNLALGEKRARIALEYLVDMGIDPKRIKVVSYGEEKAVQGAADESAWARDRRAEFVAQK
ncbi:MAG: OmpA family protein [Desulfuromonadales bacterium]|nr:OmpA family protein [Desulfuromonadales bacterium]